MNPVDKQTVIRNRMLQEGHESIPLLEKVTALQPVLWFNPNLKKGASALDHLAFTMEDVEEASLRLERFAPYLAQVFPELAAAGGIIESPLRRLSHMQQAASKHYGTTLAGQLALKMDSHLPVSGSIKARGGIYEVLTHAEKLAIKEGLLDVGSDYRVLDTPEVRAFFGRHRIEVGSTGNLGLSIGIMGARMGFQATVHMSQDARQWKKDLLRDKGVTVKEYASDYSLAVETGRKESAQHPNSYFVDDENSKDLFLGYAVAAFRLQHQLREENILVDEHYPLLVYLPCGVGGGPGGVAFGLKLVFGDHVHCFFAEPTHSPAVLLGLLTEAHDQVCVQDFGIDNCTAADGLAVGRPSGLVCRMMTPLLAGAYTVEDDELFALLSLLDETEGLQLEPSALAGMPGPFLLEEDPAGKSWLADQGLKPYLSQATHLVWATGGSMVPEVEMDGYLERARQLRKE